MVLNDLQAHYWLEMGPQAGWVAVDSLGYIREAALNLQGLLGQRLVHLPADCLVVRLRGPIISTVAKTTQ